MILLNVSTFPKHWLFGCFAYVWFCWIVHRLYLRQWETKARQNVTMVRYDSLMGKLFPAICYLWRGPEILLQNWVPGLPMAVRTPEACYVHFSSKSHIQTLKDAPQEALSLHALSKDMFFPKHTMNGLEVQDQMRANGSLHIVVLQVTLRSHLPRLFSPLKDIVTRAFEQQMASSTEVDSDWKIVNSFSMAKRVIAAANALAFFGADLASNPEFLKVAIEYPDDLFLTAEVLRLVPTIVHPLIAPILMRNHRASRTMVDLLKPVVEERLARSWEHEQDAKPADCIQFFIDANSRKQLWSADKIIQVLLGTWFAAVHQPALSLVFALESLCRHSEYVVPLRDELSQICDSPAPSAELYQMIEKAPLLDAFLKESSRLYPSDSIAMRRKVLEPFSFGDGTQLLPGDIACVPSQAIMLDESLYTDSRIFNPSRFLEQRVNDHNIERHNLSRFTDVDSAYPSWGLGKHSCPGRFYASMVLKMFITHILTRYEIRLPSHDENRTFHYRSSIIPRPTSTLLFKERV